MQTKMQMQQHLRDSIRAATREAVLQATSGMDLEQSECLHLYPQALDAAKAGATEALMHLAHQNQSRAAELGGLNRATLRTNLKRMDLI